MYIVYVITQGICNRFIEMNFCVGCMVWPWKRLLQNWTFVKYWWDVYKELAKTEDEDFGKYLSIGSVHVIKVCNMFTFFACRHTVTLVLIKMHD